MSQSSNLKKNTIYEHDRAAFHFLTNEEDVTKYIEITETFTNPTGFLFIGTFSEDGPKKCSGIKIRQYSEDSLAETFGLKVQKIKCFTIDHKTPFDTIQNFTFCGLKKTSQVFENL